MDAEDGGKTQNMQRWSFDVVPREMTLKKEISNKNRISFCSC